MRIDLTNPPIGTSLNSVILRPNYGDLTGNDTWKLIIELDKKQVYSLSFYNKHYKQKHTLENNKNNRCTPYPFIV